MGRDKNVMLIGKIQVKRRVWVYLLLALVVTVAWWVWSGSRTLIVAMKVPLKPPAVRLAKGGAGAGEKILRERAEYFDPTPLFFPTDWNYGQAGLRESMRRQPGQVFGPIEAKFTFAEHGTSPSAAPSSTLARPLAELVASGNESPFGGMGAGEFKPLSLPERSGFLEVRGLRDAKIIDSQTLVGLPAIYADFVPVEFLVVISNAGLVGAPVLVAGSGTEEVDTGLRAYTAKLFQIGGHLSPGIYRVTIGP